MRIKNLPKFITSILFILILAIILTICIKNSSLSYSKKQYTDIYISKGQTLWDIAGTIKCNNVDYNNKEIRQIVYELKELNNLDNSNLKVGQKLVVPD